MQQNFTDSVTTALQGAFADAQQRKNTEVTDNHLLNAFFQEPDGYFNSILTKFEYPSCGIDTKTATRPQ